MKVNKYSSNLASYIEESESRGSKTIMMIPCQFFRSQQPVFWKTPPSAWVPDIIAITKWFGSTLELQRRLNKCGENRHYWHILSYFLHGHPSYITSPSQNHHIPTVSRIRFFSWLYFIIFLLLLMDLYDLWIPCCWHYPEAGVLWCFELYPIVPAWTLGCNAHVEVETKP